MTALQIWLRQTAEGVNDRLAQLCARWIRKVIEVAISDLDLMGALRNATNSAEFAERHFRDVPEFKRRDQLFRWALGQVPNDSGLFLEFGVYKADSINRMAGIKPNVTFHGFDSFVGLPEGWTLGAKKGAFDVGGALPPVRDNVRLIKGFFDTTLEPFLRERPQDAISFLHIDCDLYSSTKTIFNLTRPQLGPGTVIIFDEFFNYPGWQDHEYKAFNEFVAETGRPFEYIGYVRNAGQVAVKLL